jgi:hypothetical protein
VNREFRSKGTVKQVSAVGEMSVLVEINNTPYNKRHTSYWKSIDLPLEPF